MASKLLTCLNQLAFDPPIPCTCESNYTWIYASLVFIAVGLLLLGIYFRRPVTTIVIPKRGTNYTVPNAPSFLELTKEAANRRNTEKLRIAFCETQKIPVMLAIHKGVLKHCSWILPTRSLRVKTCETCKFYELLEDYKGLTLERKEEEPEPLPQSAANPVTLF